ncbi:NAD-dependent epimerase/dehydratase [Haloferax larsenii JCM 13917]|nr:NAD-dependent epimerase/dehydratase [Haloferax larsenii JCM 13917]
MYDNFSSGNRDNVPEEATVLEADLANTDKLTTAVENADVVFHHAAQVSVERSVEKPTTSHETNLEPSLHILEAARGTDTRVIFASSAAIYGHPEYVPIDESHPKQPSSPYGLEKLTADHYCHLYHDLYGVETTALRYFNAYGPRQQGGDYSGVISIFRDQARSGDDITVEGDGDQTRDFVHVDDIVQANLLAATTDEAVGESFNIGTGESISIRGLAETIQNVTETDSDIVHVDPREGDIDRSRADISKAQTVLGFEPEYSITDGLAEYLGA